MRNIFGRINPAIAFVFFVLLTTNFMRYEGTFSDWIYVKILMLPGIVIGLSFHEAAHGYMSYWLGDPTPKIQGRLTLNPAAHFDPYGLLSLLLAGFGWGRPVQIDSRYYKHPRRDELLVSLAGVVTNFLIALAASFIIKACWANMSESFYNGIGQHILQILIYIFAVNIMLMVFNLIPVPPLDGFGILTQIFNLEKYSWYWEFYQKGGLILMFLLIFGVTSRIMDPCYEFFVYLLLV